MATETKISTNGHTTDNIIDESSIMSIDIGGLLIKLVYVKYYNKIRQMNEEKIDEFLSNLNDISLSNVKNKRSKNENFEIYFYLFDKPTSVKLLNFIVTYSDYIFFIPNQHKITLTGTSANNFKRELKTRLGNKINSIESIILEFYSSYGGIEVIKSLNYETGHEWYTYDKLKTMSESCQYENYIQKFVENIDDSFILVYIGTGTSVLHITRNQVNYLLHFNISGGTYFGLCKLLCNFKTFEEAIKSSEIGNNKLIDYTMYDMIDGNKETLNEITDTMKESNATECGATEDGPDVDFIINSFGKLNISNLIDNDMKNIDKNDIANAVLLMVINSCTLNACHFAKKNNCKQIIYAGSFLLNNNYAKFKIAKLARYLTNDVVSAVFSDKDAFMNAIGGLFNYKDYKINFNSCM
jgi:pantothenate kinase